MTETVTKPDIFLACDEVREAAAHMERVQSGGRYWNVLDDWQDIRPKRKSPVVFVSTVMNVDRVFVRRVRSIARKKAFLLICKQVCRALPERLAWLDVRDPERIHVAQPPKDNGTKTILQHFFSAMSHEDQAERVFDAWWEEDTFVVMSPRFKRLKVPLGRLKPLSGKPRTDLDEFEIDEEGAYVYWPTFDVHLGWEQFSQSADDAEAYLKARQQSEEFNRRYGAAIRKRRVEKGLRQSDIAGLTPRQVGRIERGECRATHSALSKLAAKHEMDLSDYMAVLADAMH